MNQSVPTAACGLTLGLAFGLSSSALAQSFTGVGYLPGGGSFSEALGVSNDGTIVVGSSDAAGVQERAFIWTNGVITGIPNSGSYRPAIAFAISDNRVVVGTSYGPNGPEAFKYNSINLSFRALGGTVAGGMGSSARAISADGRTTVGFRSHGGSSVEACVWTGPSPVGLGYLTPGGLRSAANGISANAAVIVGESIAAGLMTHEAFIASGGAAMVSLGTLGGGFSFAHAISDDGMVIVGSSTRSVPGTHAFSYDVVAGLMTDLGELAGGADFSDALAVNADGTVIVGRSAGASGTVAMIWDANHGVRSLKDVLINRGVSNLASWTLSSASGISDDGTVICGWGLNPLGLDEGWVAVLPAAPPHCPADFNDDTAVDFFDYDDFVTCFEGGACPPGKTADFNNDTAVDFFDYDDFVVAFETPC